MCPADSDETFVRLPFAMTTPDGADPEPMPAPFEEGEKRPAGVHLHWAMPDSLLERRADRPRSGRREPALAVLRFPTAGSCCGSLIPRGGERATVTGWVIEADTTNVTAARRLAAVRSGREPPTGKTIAPDVADRHGWRLAQLERCLRCGRQPLRASTIRSSDLRAGRRA